MDFNSFLKSLRGGDATVSGDSQTGLVGDASQPTPMPNTAVSRPSGAEEGLVKRDSTSLEQRLAGGANRSASDALAAAAEKPPAKESQSMARGQALVNSPNLTLDLDESATGQTVPQLEGAPITHYATEPPEGLRKLIAVNSAYITYGLKAGQVRVLHRRSAARALLKSHKAQLTDLRFFDHFTDDLASASTEGRIVVWRLAALADEIHAQQLMTLLLQAGNEPVTTIQLAWHPRWSEVLAITAGSQVMVCSLPALAESGAPELICDIDSPPSGAAVVPFPSAELVTALAFSTDGSRLAAGTADGWVRVAASTSLATVPEAAIVAATAAGADVSSLTWLSASTLLTGSNGNAELQIWRLDDELGFQHQQKISLQSSQPHLNNLAFDSNYGILLLANAKGNTVATLHLSPSMDSFDALAQYAVTMPILSLEARSSLQNGADSGGVIQVFTVQTQAIQQYSLQPAHCLPAVPEEDLPIAAAEGSSPPGEATPEAPQVSGSALDSGSSNDNDDNVGAPLSGQAASTSLSTGELPNSSSVPIAVPPPQPSPTVQPHLLTPSQLMQAAKAALPRTMSGNSSIVEAESMPRPPPASAGASYQQRNILSSTTFTPAVPSAFLQEPGAVKAIPSNIPGAIPSTSSGLAENPMGEGFADAAAAPVPPPSALGAIPSNARATEAHSSMQGLSPSLQLSSRTGSRTGSAAASRQSVAPASSTKEAGSGLPISSPPRDTLEAVRQALQGVQDGESPTAASAVERQVAPALSSLDELYEKLQRDQKKLLQQLTQNQQATVRALREETRKETKRLETATDAQIARLMKAQLKTIAEERKALIAEERQNLEKLLVAISSSINRDLPQRIEEILRREVSSVTKALGSAVQAALADALPKELAGSAFQASLEKSLGAQLKVGLAKPMQEGFRTSFQQHVLPAFEAACQSMFAQVQATFAGGLAEHLQAAGANTAVSTTLKDAIGQANAIASKLSEDVSKGYQQLLELANQEVQGRHAAHVAGHEAPQAADPKAEITKLMDARRYEEAFNKALDLGDVSIVAWLCTQVEPQTLLASTPPLLSQQVLLVLLQQLGYDLSKDTSVKVLWIKEIAVELDPHDHLLAPHMHSVLQTVLHNLQQFRFEGQNIKLARFAIAVIESAMKSCKPYRT